MPPKRQVVWNDLNAKVSAKRTRTDGINRGKSSAPQEIVVQKLSSEPDNKQTYRPIQPREFVAFEYEELTVANLKKACGHHFHMPASTCDVLVSNKGPSCTNISQIPHRKDKVYLVRFGIGTQDGDAEVISSCSNPESEVNGSTSSQRRKKCKSSPEPETQFPESVSIEQLLLAGKLVKPQQKDRVVLELESFGMQSRSWQSEAKLELLLEREKFSSGAFRDAFKGTVEVSGEQKMFVVKTYNERAQRTIQQTLNVVLEDHARKNVQMHAVARHITKGFSLKVPPEFGQCFEYNKVFYSSLNGKPVTVEDFVPGKFAKYVNNDGKCVAASESSSSETKNIYAKAQCLVHYSYSVTQQKMMLTDIQGSKYALYDPEISTENLIDDDELYFCCGNLSVTGMQTFLNEHECNKYCKMLKLEEEN